MPRGKKVIDITGRRFGRLVVLQQAEQSQSGDIRWLCQCDCGKITTVRGSCLRSGHTQSCGCYQRERTGNANRRHGETDSRIHHEWAAIKARCYNPKNKRYNRYGGRGITLCPEWRESFEAFRYWALANGYRDDLTIDRIDNDGNYCPENCRWATQKEQQNKRSNTKKVEYKGETRSLKQWAEKYGIRYATFYRRLRDGWSFEDALTMPLQHQKKAKELGL